MLSAVYWSSVSFQFDSNGKYVLSKIWCGYLGCAVEGLACIMLDSLDSRMYNAVFFIHSNPDFSECGMTKISPINRIPTILLLTYFEVA